MQRSEDKTKCGCELVVINLFQLNIFREKVKVYFKLQNSLI
jgi:hypothetical protein